MARRVGIFFFNAFFGVPELTILKQLGLDAMVVGNHEFDFGPGVLAMALSQVGAFPLVGANLDLTGYPALGNWIKPGIIKEIGGVKVGIVGVTIPGDPLSQPKPVVVRTDIGPAAYAAIAGLRAQGAEVIILLSHLGLAYDQQIAAAVPGIDFVVGGHDHDLLTEPIPVANPDGRTTLIVEAGEFYEQAGKLRFFVEDGAVRFLDYGLIPIDASVPPAPSVQAVIDQLKQLIVQKYGPVYTEVLAQAADDVPDSYDPTRAKRDTAIGNLVADALRHATGTEIGLTVSGLVSEGLYAGPLVGADLFRPVSYGYDSATGLGFQLATFDVLGSELLKGMETCLVYTGVTTTFDLQVSGMRFRFDSRKPAGQRVLLGSVRIHGQVIDPAQTYSVTTNAGIAMLLPLMGVSITNLELLPTLEYSALKDYVVELGVVSYSASGRVRDEALRPACHGRHPSHGFTDARP